MEWTGTMGVKGGRSNNFETRNQWSHNNMRMCVLVCVCANEGKVFNLNVTGTLFQVYMNLRGTKYFK